MKVLVVCSATTGKISPFIVEQVNSLLKNGLNVEYFLIKNKGLFGYLKSYFLLLKKLASSKFDIVHAHYGLSGFISVFQAFAPVIITFHGSDINEKRNLWISKIAARFANYSLFVEESMYEKVGRIKNGKVLPCGVDINTFKPIDKTFSRKILNFGENISYGLFASSFNNPIKNAALAIKVCSQVDNLQLIELNNYSREEVNVLLNACDFLIMTSLNEGSPQVIKEAMATNCPVVSVNVGDVKERLAGVGNAFVTDFGEENLLCAVRSVLSENARTNGRERLLASGLDLNSVALQLMDLYKTVKN